MQIPIEHKECAQSETKCVPIDCHAMAGNCVDNLCVWDSGYYLDTEKLQTGNEKEYSWQHNSLSKMGLQRFSLNKIPKIFHQSWKTTAVPERYVAWQQSCQQHHKDWDYLFWTDDDNRKLIIEEYPWLLYTYDRLKGSILYAPIWWNLCRFRCRMFKEFGYAD